MHDKGWEARERAWLIVQDSGMVARQCSLHARGHYIRLTSAEKWDVHPSSVFAGRTKRAITSFFFFVSGAHPSHCGQRGAQQAGSGWCECFQKSRPGITLRIVYCHLVLRSSFYGSWGSFQFESRCLALFWTRSRLGKTTTCSQKQGYPTIL